MSCTGDYILGQRLRFPLEFKVAGVLTDPTAIRFEHRAPSDTVTTTWTYPSGSEIVRDSVGKFHVDLDLDEAGRWKWRVESDGVETADQGSFRVIGANV